MNESQSFIHRNAQLGTGTVYGHNFVAEDGVKIGCDCQIGHNVVIRNGSIVGDRVRIDDNTVIGKQPLRSPRSIFKDEEPLPPTRIGDDCLIGAGVIIYTGCAVGQKNLFADLSTVRENVVMGDFNIVGRGVAIENYCQIGSRNKFETNSYITAYSQVGDYCFVAPGVLTSNDNYMGRDPERFKHFKGVVLETGARLGVGTVILPGRTIHSDAAAGAGSLVTADIPTGEIRTGLPARFFKNVPEAQLLINNKDKK